jgi:hypothetical protein
MGASRQRQEGGSFAPWDWSNTRNGLLGSALLNSSENELVQAIDVEGAMYNKRANCAVISINTASVI